MVEPDIQTPAEVEQQQAQDYAEWMEKQRGWLAKNRKEVNKLLKTLPDQSLLVLRKVMTKLVMIHKDSEPHASHWAVAQCREVLAEWDESLALITKFEKAKKSVAAYDQEESAKQAKKEKRR